MLSESRNQPRDFSQHLLRKYLKRAYVALGSKSRPRAFAKLNDNKFGLFLIYRKLKSLIIHIPRVEIVNHSYTELGGGGGGGGNRGTVGAEEHRAQRNIGSVGTEGTEEQRAQRNSRHRGTVGSVGTEGTEEQ